MAPATPSVSERVVQMVATETDTDQLDLPPLFEAIDPDALDSIMETMTDGELSFAYAGTTVSVDSTGAVQITGSPLAASTDAQCKGVETTD